MNKIKDFKNSYYQTEIRSYEMNYNHQLEIINKIQNLQDNELFFLNPQIKQIALNFLKKNNSTLFLKFLGDYLCEIIHLKNSTYLMKYIFFNNLCQAVQKNFKTIKKSDVFKFLFKDKIIKYLPRTFSESAIICRRLKLKRNEDDKRLFMLYAKDLYQNLVDSTYKNLKSEIIFI